MFKFLTRNSRGEVATTLTILSFLLLAGGTILGSFVAQQETKIRSEAAKSNIEKLSGYHWNECQQGLCDPNFDGRTDNNDWCQGNKIRCGRKNGKVCQMPDPWCDGQDQGAASICIGVHQKGTDASQTCKSAGKSCGDGRCDGPNENWETCSASECPYVTPGAGGTQPSPTPATQCQAEGGTCQRADVCGVSIPNTYNDGDKGCSTVNPQLPVCCKSIGATPTSTPIPTGSLTPTPTLIPNAVTIVTNITTNNTKQYTKVEALGCPNNNRNDSNCRSYTLYEGSPVPVNNENKQHSFQVPDLDENKTYYVNVKILNQALLYETNPLNNNLTDVQVPSTVTFNINLLDNHGTGSHTIVRQLNFSYTPADYKKVMDGYISGIYSAIQISEWVSRATNSPGLKIQFCDPMKGECNIPF